MHEEELRWDNVPARVWVPNALIGALGAIIGGIIALVLIEWWGVSRTVTGWVHGLGNFAEGI